ncbi:MAG: TlpA disulfide reductase family protein [Gaiellales bacterium]
MGKSSRNKHAQVTSTPRKPFPFFWAAIGLIIVGGIAAMVITRPDDTTNKRTDAAQNIPVYADVTIDGDDLPTWGGSGEDSAIGDPVATISGTSMENEQLTLAPEKGTAYVYAVMAHWCPHCNNEVPKIVDFVNDKNLPDGVEIVGVSTSAQKGQPNFPPATWLAREKWEFPTIIDDEVGTAAAALGTSSFPNLVFVDADGKVAQRYNGEMPTDEFNDAIKKITPDTP